jgi:hypothetical protein
MNNHPCQDKCSDFKDEQCRTCLIKEIEAREFDLGVAPDEAYIKPYLTEAMKSIREVS